MTVPLTAYPDRFFTWEGMDLRNFALHEALEFIRSEGERQRTAALAEFRRDANQAWTDLGLRRPLEADDAEEALRLIRLGISSLASVAAAYRPLIRALSSLAGADPDEPEGIR